MMLSVKGQWQKPRRALKARDEESQWVAVEDRRRRRFAFEETARGILRTLEDSEDLKVSVTELQDQLGMSEEADTSCSAGKKRKRPIFLKFFRQGEEEVCIASLARWNAQWKGLVELERRCRDTMQEVKLLSDRQELLKGMVQDKIRLQSRATEKSYDQILEEMKKLEEKKSEEALLLLQKRHDLWRYLNERDEARRLQSSGSSRRVRKGFDLQHPFSSESCRSSTVDYVRIRRKRKN